MTTAPPLLEVRDVSRSFFEDAKEFAVLEPIRFDVHDQDFVCVTGPSGCGKSTLLRIIVGLDRPTSGEVLFEGVPIRADNPQVAMVFQSFALFPWLTIEEAVYLADRVIVLSPRPGKVIADLRIDLPRPRNRKEPEFYGWVDEIYSLSVR